MNIRSLRARVTCWYVGLLAVALLVFGACLYFGFERYLETSLERSLAGEARSIAQTFVSEVEAKGPTWLSEELSESYPPEADEHYIRVSRLAHGSDFQVLYQSSGGRDVSLPGPPPATPANLRNPRLRIELGNRNLKVVVYSFPYKSASGTQYLIETGAPHGRIEQLLRSLLMMLLILTPLVLLGAAVGGYFMMAQPLKPMVSLTQQAERIGIGELGERLSVIPTGDELERLSLSLNRMISRLEEALAHNRRFSADVSHELRTPLTILRGELEHVIQLRNAGSEVVESVGSALEEIERLAKIVESLLAISHLDTGGAGIEFSRFDLREMVKTTAEQMRLLADEKQITLGTDSSGPVYAFGDESRVKQVLVNLLDNAIKYSRQGGHVVISVSAEENTSVLTVRDNGIGIPADSIPHVFERFYRAEKARPRGTAGAGLGLSIVQAISRAHGGAVSITSAEGRGTTVEVRLPAGELASLPVTQDQKVAIL
jgi:two-component system, OmpR family, sensor kinase